MTFPAALAACLAAFMCHALLHGRRYRLPALPPRLWLTARALRVAAPLAALAGAVVHDGITGVLIWFAALGMAGIATGLALAMRQP